MYLKDDLYKEAIENIESMDLGLKNNGSSA